MKRGQTVEFPVAANHEHAPFQDLKRVQSAEDLGHFPTLWTHLAEKADAEPPNADLLAAQLAAAEVSVLSLAARHLVIPEGSKMVLNGELNRLRFDEIDIQGTLEVRGHLELSCDVLRGSE